MRVFPEPPPAATPRTVKPRKSKADRLPVITVTRDMVIVEAKDDDVFATSDLGRILVSSPPSIIAVQGFGSHLLRLQREFADDPQFNYRVTPLYRYSRPWSDGRKLKPTMITDTICNLVGWKSESKSKANQYHYPIDPLWFLSTGIDELDDSDNVRAVKLHKWGKQVRDWCTANGLKIKASSGGIAAQLLRDSRFYPEPRRKAPQGINKIIRPKLPGNYYRLHHTTEIGKRYRAIYLDMENAHHEMAKRIKFPDVETLHAYGDWSYEARQEDNPNTHPGGPGPRIWRPGDSPILARPGIFHVRITVPHIPNNLFPPPYMEQAGIKDVYLYSNELELVRHFGGKITGIHAAYVSEGYETGLNKYARWAIREIKSNPEIKPWLKPTLHSTYGLLAARPVTFETGYYRARAGTEVMYPMGNASIPAISKRNKRPVEARIVNVIHRGMIEAEVRREALWYARLLTEVDRHQVLAIYADAIFLRDTGREVRLLEAPWRLSKTVSNLKFHSPVHFTSPSISRLPGVPKTARDRFTQGRNLAKNQELERYWQRGTEQRAESRHGSVRRAS